MSYMVLRSYYAAAGPELEMASPEAILGKLVTSHAFATDEKQRDAWRSEIIHLQKIANELPGAFFFLEFAIPRMGKRVDAIIVVSGHIFVLEYKTGSQEYETHAADQVLDYALDLKNFHEGSHNLAIIPVLVATDAPAKPFVMELWADDVVRPIPTNQDTLLPVIRSVLAKLQPKSIDPTAWANSPYKPTPTIIEAAQALYRGHDVQEITRTEAGADNLARTANYIVDLIDKAKIEKRKAICFVTGVPGSGKTLAGLNIANQRMRASEEENAVFLSGNGPLVDVLREALALDEVERSGINKRDAYRHASAFIQNIHHFRDEYLTVSSAPTGKVVVFDEAQRAWTREQTSRFMREKRGRQDFDKSEPEFLMSVMNRHPDWCVVVCLIGGGQEINTGEAGLEEWIMAIKYHHADWELHLSDRLTEADYLAMKSAPEALAHLKTTYTPALHLGVSVRSFRAETVSDFVKAVIDGDAPRAAQRFRLLTNYPVVITRNLEAARDWLRWRARGSERIGLVASSNAMRLKPVGIYVKSKIDPAVWFLADKTDVRSSFALEDVATEFDIQGLELDWVGVCWDANFRRDGNQWKAYYFRGTRWDRINDDTRAAYLANSYRVLLTRARQGMVIFVPVGSEIDDTRVLNFYDKTYAFLCECGITKLV